MSHKTYRISGRVINRKTKDGVAGLPVEAWDKDLIFNDLVGSAVTDEQGAFEMQFDEAYFRELFLDRRPDLVFKVFLGDKLIKSTEDSVLWNVDKPNIEVVIEVELPATEPESKPLVVRGQVVLEDGTPIPDVTVRAFDQDLRHEETLGKTVTDKAGSYGITYTAEQFRRVEKGSADLIVRAFNADAELLAASPTLFNAPAVATIDLVVGASVAGVPSEYERLLEELEPLLADMSVEGIRAPTLNERFADLKSEDIDFLTGETGIDRQKIEVLTQAARLRKQGHAEGFELPAAVFYGLAREGLPLDLSALYTHSPKAQRDALNQALTDNIIPAVLEHGLDRILVDLQKLIAGHALKTPPIEGGHSLGDLLNLTLPSPDKQASLLALYTSHTGPIEDFWTNLRQQSDFQAPGLVDGIQRNLQLGMLTRNHVPLIQELQRAYEITSARDLVKLDSEAWKAVINTQVDGKPIGVPPGVPGDTSEERVTNYVSNTVGLLQATFPTDVIAEIVAKSPAVGLDDSTRQGVTRFFANTPDLDFRTTRVDTYIAEHADTAFKDIPEGDRAKVVGQVKRLQRLFQVSTGPETMTALVGSGLDSAYGIANTPRATFVQKMKGTLGGEQNAQAVYDRAQRVHATALHVYTHLYQAINDVQLFVLGSSAEAVREVLVQQSPTLAELFGPLELCDCEDCRSVLSPAAYFVDLLHLLENSIPNGMLNSPLDVLLGRRPDLAYIKLTCENTNTLIPYVDLINEALESYVAYGQTLPMFQSDVPPPMLPIRIPMPNDSSDGVTADELAANPENTNAAAYSKLQDAVYPIALPYDQSLEVIGVYLDHLGSSRHEIMQTFQKAGTPPDLDIACEYLRMSPDERDILTGKSTKTLRDFYGYDATAHSANTQPQLQQGARGSDVIALRHLLNSAGAKPVLTVDGNYEANTQAAVAAFQQAHGNISENGVGPATWAALDNIEEIWLAYLAQVSEFLQHTGISYPECVELVQTRFINPNQQAVAYLESLNINYKDLADWVASGYTTPSQALQNAIQKAYPTLQLDEALQKLHDWSDQYFEQLQKIIVLYAPPDAQCDLSVTGIQDLDGTDVDISTGGVIFAVPAGADAKSTWIKIQHFLRLWRTLGWSMSDLDRTLTALGASDTTPDVLQKLAQVKRLQADLNVPLVQLLTLWANIDTWGSDSLYKKLFLNKAALQLDDAFVLDTFGQDLAAYTAYKRDPAHTPLPTISKKAIPVLLAAFRISEIDLDLIRIDTPALVGSDAALNLASLSLLYRYTVLARALKLRIGDFIALKTLSGIDPFGAPDTTGHFVDVVGQMQQSGFNVAQLNYLYRHLTAPPTNLAPQATTLLLLAKRLRDGLTQIARDNVLVPDPTGDVTRTKLSTLLDSGTVDQAITMINGTAVYSAPLAQLPDAIAAKDKKNAVVGIDPTKVLPPVAKKISYDAKAQMLRFQGAMTTSEQTALRNSTTGPVNDAAYQAAVDNLFAQPATFIENALSGFLDPREARNTLVRNIPSLDQDLKPVLLDQAGDVVTVATQAVTTAIASKFAYLLAQLLPYQTTTLSHAFVKQTIADALKVDNAMAQLLLESVLKRQVVPSEPGLDDVLAFESDGLHAQYFTSANLTGTPSVETNATLAFDGRAKTLPAHTQSARWAGMLLAPDNGAFTFTVHANGTVQLWVDDDITPLTLTHDAPNNLWISPPVALTVVQFYKLRLEMMNLPPNAIAELYWQSATIPRAIISAEHLYPDAVLPVTDLLAIQTPGLTASYFPANDLTGTPSVRTDATVGFAGQSTLPAATQSARWTGMLLAPNNADFTFAVQASGTVQLWVDDDIMPLTLTLDTTTNEWVSAAVTLKAGQLYHLRLELTKLTSKATAELFWQSATLSKAIIPADNLYPRALLDVFRVTFIRLQKASLLINMFQMSANEVDYLSAHATDFAGFDLNALPLARDPQSAGQIDQNARALFTAWQRLNAYVTLRNSLPRGEVNFVDVFTTASFSDTQIPPALSAPGLTARYFTSPDLSGLPVLRADPQIAFDGTGTTPATIIPAQTGSARWSGLLLAPSDGGFSFAVRADGRVQLSVGDETVPLGLTQDPATKEWTSAAIVLKGGQLYDLRLEVSQIATPTPPHTSTVVELLWRNAAPTYTVVPAANLLTGVLATIAECTGWDPQVIATLVGPDGFNLTTVDFRNEIWLVRLQECIRLVTRLGVSAAQLFTWAGVSPNPLQSIAQDIKKTVRAKYDDATWLTVAKPLSDKLRESQRDALVAYLLPRLGLSDSNQLFEYLLIDVDMSACMMTSRIKQAISSVQLFVDRCLMNLESPDVSSDAIDPDVWQWMKHYRIWEANRKVFLYPENWILPELRDNKSPFFKDLESGLLQNDLTMHKAETAFLAYLQKLDEVARLEICGMYLQDNSGDFPTLSQNSTGPDVVELQRKLNAAGANPPLTINGKFDPDTYNAVIAFQQRNNLNANGTVGPETWAVLDSGKTVSILHVFGRTFHTPHVYYYRQLINDTTWTAWDKVQVDIEGDHLIPVVGNRRLQLYWPIFSEKTVPDKPTSVNVKNGTASTSAGEPAKYLEIKLAWSECKSGTWSAKKMLSEREILRTNVPTVEFISPDDRAPELDTSLYVFKAEAPIGEGSLRIRCVHRAKSRTVVDNTQTTVYTIHQPPVIRRDTRMDQVTFKPGDVVNIRAGGCVQTAGSGRTWKRYVNPVGPDCSETALYHGLIGLPGMVGLTRISDFISAGNNYVIPSANDMTLHLGYEDDNYTDAGGNGYWGHDDGNCDQCKLENDGGPAWIEITIIRQPDNGGGGEDGIAEGHFDFTGCTGGAQVRPFAFSPESLVEPVRSVEESMTFKEASGSTLTLSTGEVPILTRTPSTYRLLYAHQFPQFSLQAPFFYQDDTRTYFVTAQQGCGYPCQVFNSTLVRLDPSNVAPIDAISIAVTPSAIISSMRGFTASSITGTAPAANMALSKTPITQSGAAARSFTMDSLGVDWATQNTKRFMQWLPPLAWQHSVWTAYDLKFATYYHPYVCRFIIALNQGGIPRLLSIVNQTPKDTVPEDNGGTVFYNEYFPTFRVDYPYPHENVDFSTEGEGAYSLYNWELFFHTVMLIATRLSQNQRFAEARQWFHYVFDPTVGSSDSNLDKTPTARYWKLLPFKATVPERIQDLLETLSYTGTDPKILEQKNRVLKQLEEYMYHPFQPHAIARLRPGAYMRNVVMKYLDNLIAWGDQLFRQDTIESINEATQLYVLAANILGPRPQRIPNRGKVEAETYATLKGRLDTFSNAIVTLENEFPFSSGASASPDGPDERGGILGLGKVLYFCTPQNATLLAYWDIVADRLFKIRHCMNIGGVVRQLPLFEPPIDPALLVQAAAAGVDLSSVLNDINAALPYYRFGYMLQKALEMCTEVRALGAALLSALEKKDAEELAAIRASQETSILSLVRLVKQKQYDEATDAYNALLKSRDVAITRYSHYHRLLGEENLKIPKLGETMPETSISVDDKPVDQNGVKIISYEKEDLDRSELARNFQLAASGIEFLANPLHLIPEASVNLEPFGVGASISFGGSNIGAALSSFANYFHLISNEFSYEAANAAKLGNFVRRQQEWVLQANLAAKDIMQIDQQIFGADIRVAIANQELLNHDQQIENAKQIEDFLRVKFSNEDLYAWMSSEVSAIYFQCYQMAYDLAKKAEKCYRFERGLTVSKFIQFGYWDSLKEGLLSGERLYLALKQVEQAYHEQNKREYEIAKSISLVLLDPLPLITLKETGQCEIFLPELLFDADYPGHYMRRIKSVSLTIPCVVGPYTSINCTLTLLSNKTRITPVPADPYPENQEDEDDRFVTNFVPLQSIATSHAQNDSGLFELNFRDERYLPFEGAGVISRWRIEMDKELAAFDFNTISDAVLHLKYTAREGGELLKTKAKATLQDAIADVEKYPQSRLFSLRHEFPNQWNLFKQNKEVSFAIGKNRLPFFAQNPKLTVEVESTTWIARYPDINFTMTLNGQKVSLTRRTDLNDLLIGTSEAIALANDDKDKDNIIALSATITDSLEDLMVLIQYTVDGASSKRT